jgi:hypothetical protein
MNRTEHNVLGRGGPVPEVKEAVVLGVDEELGSAGLGLAGVSLYRAVSDKAACNNRVHA